MFQNRQKWHIRVECCPLPNKTILGTRKSTVKGSKCAVISPTSGLSETKKMPSNPHVHQALHKERHPLPQTAVHTEVHKQMLPKLQSMHAPVPTATKTSINSTCMAPDKQRATHPEDTTDVVEVVSTTVINSAKRLLSQSPSTSPTKKRKGTRKPYAIDIEKKAPPNRPKKQRERRILVKFDLKNKYTSETILLYHTTVIYSEHKTIQSDIPG